MSIDIRIQSKAEIVVQAEAKFFGVSAPTLMRAATDKLILSGGLRDFMQGVDLQSYEARSARASKVAEDRLKNPKTFFLDGKPVRLRELSLLSGIPQSTLWRRIKNGMTAADAIKVRDMRQNGGSL